MRKVTSTIIQAFRNREKKSVGSSRTDGQALYLHGNKIAEFRDCELWVTLAGWPTITTRERLNGLPDVSVQQSKHTQFLNGQEWDGSWQKVG